MDNKIDSNMRSYARSLVPVFKRPGSQHVSKAIALALKWEAFPASYSPEQVDAATVLIDALWRDVPAEDKGAATDRVLALKGKS